MRGKAQFLFLIASACALLLLGGAARAQELISAKILSVEGLVEIRRRTADRPQIRAIAFGVDEELRAGDTILTGRGGRLVLGLTDGSQAVIAPQSTVVISDLGRSPRTLFNLVSGKARVQIERRGGRPNPYRVHTPTAVIAVRGTIFDALVGEKETRVFVHEGEVAVTSSASPDQSVFLFAGQTIRVRPSGLPSVPGTFKAGRNDKAFRATKHVAADERATRPEPGRAEQAARDAASRRTPSAAQSAAGDSASGRAGARASSRTGGRRH